MHIKHNRGYEGDDFMRNKETIVIKRTGLSHFYFKIDLEAGMGPEELKHIILTEIEAYIEYIKNNTL